MKGFPSNLINRHIRTETNIVPRLRGRFEPEQNSFHEDINPAPVNAAGVFSERVSADDNKGPETEAETSTYRPVIANTAKRQQPNPQPEPEIPAQVNFNAAKAAFTTPAAVTPVADNVKPRNAHFDGIERAVPNEPPLPGKLQIATAYQHDFNANFSANPAKSGESGMVWNKPEQVEERDQALPFTGKKTGRAATENADGGSKSMVQVNEPAQPENGFKSLSSGMQNSINAMAAPNLSNGNLRDGGQKSFQHAAQPIIKVTIGRIEVKAVHPPQAPAAMQRREPQKPMLTLDDFLSQHKRNGQ